MVVGGEHQLDRRCRRRSLSEPVARNGRVRPELQPDTWHRLALIFRSDEQDKTFLETHIDGTFAGFQTLNAPVDGRFSLDPADALNGLALLLTENGTHTSSGFLSSVLFIDRPLNPYEIDTLGSPSADGIVVTSCGADINGDGQLNVLDFVAFQALWEAQDPSADCDVSGTFDVLDFVCFQQQFVAGCGM